MVRLAISVEGLTEERFVGMVFAPYLQEKGIYAIPLSLGGGILLARVKKELNHLANSFEKVTTLYDFYGFSGKGEDESKESVEQKILESVAVPLRDRIIPYIQMYEFEGLLFSSPETIENNVHQTGLADWAIDVLKKFNNNPEKINNSQQTAPSKRLENKSAYIKSIQGPNIASEIGLDIPRERCAGFGGWLSSLEALQR